MSLDKIPGSNPLLKMNFWKTYLVTAGAVGLLAVNTALSHPEKTGLAYHEGMLKHDTGPAHPESKARLSAIMSRLKDVGLLSGLKPIKVSPAPLNWIFLVHPPEYVAEVERRCTEGKTFLHSQDTPVSKDSYEAARLAAGGVLCAIDAVMGGEVENAFCAIRPPGHHSSGNTAMGFCIFNNAAIGARYVQEKYKLKKVLIVDFDVHHGNGTQKIFNDDPDVLYFSIHRSPFYPGTGGIEERGTGKGCGLKVNVPVPRGSGDKEYLRAFEEILKPQALEFKPDFILVSAGFDAHADDPLGGMAVTAECYAAMTRVVKELAEKCCNGRLVSLLEGGYGLHGLADSVEKHISVLRGD
ncbi:MAG: histone deacetylase [Victivallales bacterium]|jgi:acetoin utilization deacetylase AcuC-like enzyme